MIANSVGAALLEMVLHSTQRYTGLLDALLEQKHALNDGRAPHVFVWAFGGVSEQGPLRDGGDADAEFEREFGTAPGCAGEHGKAVPPVRLQAVAEKYRYDAEPVSLSVCTPEWSERLGAIGRTESPERDCGW